MPLPLRALRLVSSVGDCCFSPETAGGDALASAMRALRCPRLNTDEEACDDADSEDDEADNSS
jgi:hypothetical protein